MELNRGIVPIPHFLPDSHYNLYDFTEALAMGNQLELLEAEAWAAETER